MKYFTFLLPFFLLLSINAASQSCLPEGITFSNQSQIDNFQINYPNCTEIEGSVSISSDEITNLNGLIQIEKIEGGLLICYNESLINLDGLDNLDWIGGEFKICANNSTLSINALGSLTHIGEHLSIWHNDGLTDISGFESLNYLGGHLSINHNDSLGSINGFNILSHHNGLIEIAGNEDLLSIDGFHSLDSIIGSLNIGHYGEYSYCGNPLLESISAFSSLTYIAGDLNLFVNRSLIDVSGFGNIISIGEDLVIIGSDDLTEIELNNLSTISGSLTIGDVHVGLRGYTTCLGNSSLKNLDELTNLTSINGDLNIFCNDSLVSLTGLENVTTIGGGLMIGDQITYWQLNAGNPLLANLSGLENINPNSIVDLQIVGNESLETCEVYSICSYLLSPNGTVEISDNAPGCTTEEEILEACELVSIDEATLNSFISFYPNPARDEIFINNPSAYPIKEIRIYNQAGQVLYIQNSSQERINTSSLQTGVYIIEIITAKSVYREKLIVNRE